MEVLKQGTIIFSILLAIIVFIIFSILQRRYKNITKYKRQPPKASGAWPIIGHLPLLRPPKLQHKVLGTMADKYGPIFRISLGLNQTVVISSSEIAKECLLTHDKATSGRPKSIAIGLMTYNYADFAFGPYDSYWRSVRKIVMVKLLSNHRVTLLSYVWKSEINTLMKNMYDVWNNNIANNNKGLKFVLVDMKQLFGDLNMKITLRIICRKQFGKNSDESDRIQKAVMKFFRYISCYTIGDVIPFLRWLDLRGEEKVMKRVFKDLDDILEGWLQEHKERRKNNDKEDQDFMDIMLSVLENDPIKDCTYDTDTIIKSTCLSLVAGGIDTITITLIWALSLLMNNPQTLNKAKNELDLVVGKERHVSDHDIPKLQYLQAIVKETLRLNPPAPLMGPREFVKNCTIGGYNVERGTRLIVNLSKIFLDPEYWDDPTAFRPERFLSNDHKDIDVKGQHFELFPFGAGRRICPGLSFTLQVVHLTLASLLHGFEFASLNDEPIDMSESFGLTNLKKEPLKVLISPSLTSRLYA